MLVDRTLDLTAPSLHLSESLADRILSLLPHSPADSNDVCVDMSPIATSGGQSDEGGGRSGVCIAHGSLAQPSSTKAQQVLRTLIHSKQKVCLFVLTAIWAFVSNLVSVLFLKSSIAVTELH